MTTNIAEQLVELADSEGLSPRLLLRFPKLLGDLQVTEDDVERAHRLFRAKVDGTLAKVRQEETTTTEPTIRTPRRTSGGGKPQVKVFGKYSATAVLRWMGKNDWTPEDAAVALATLGCAGISDITIKIQLRAGKNGERGEPAPVTASEGKRLVEASK